MEYNIIKNIDKVNRNINSKANYVSLYSTLCIYIYEQNVHIFHAAWVS